MTVGILYICTGNYVRFWSKFYRACEKYFLPNTDKKYFVFTDKKEQEILRQVKAKSDKITVFYLQHKPWPYVTINRFATFLQHRERLNTDYLFFFNANLLCVAPILEEEFLPNGGGGGQHLLATQAMGFFERPIAEFTYERNPKSAAYIPIDQGEKYFQGGLQGGKSEYFLQACEEMNAQIMADLSKDIIAVWHDESHWNKYLLNRKDVKIMSPAYLFPQYCDSNISPKIIVIDKNNYGGHTFMRSSYRSLFVWRLVHLCKPHHLRIFVRFKLYSTIIKLAKITSFFKHKLYKCLPKWRRGR